jgi:hypothetical protein
LLPEYGIRNKKRKPSIQSNKCKIKDIDMASIFIVHS